MRKQCITLKYGVDVSLFSGKVSDIFTVQNHPAVINVFQTGNKTQNGGFSAARRAENGQELAMINREVKVSDDIFIIERLADTCQTNNRLWCCVRT